MVDTDTDTVPGGSNGWTVEFTTTTTTVYTTTTIQEWVVTGMDCINQGGNIVGGWDWATPEEGNPNCVAAYQDEPAATLASRSSRTATGRPPSSAT